VIEIQKRFGVNNQMNSRQSGRTKTSEHLWTEEHDIKLLFAIGSGKYDVDRKFQWVLIAHATLLGEFTP
jgi:hypothetical protein